MSEPLMTEKKGYREAVERMANNLEKHGMAKEKAREKALAAAKRVERKKAEGR